MPNLLNQVADSRALPWQTGTLPLMLAPMQGLTNRALRAYFIKQVRPDVVFTEFMRVNPLAAVKRLSPKDLREMAADEKTYLRNDGFDRSGPGAF